MAFEVKNKYTRKIDKAYNKALLVGAETIRENGVVKFKTDPAQIEDANDVLISMMCDVPMEKVEALDGEEYKEVLQKVMEAVAPQ